MSTVSEFIELAEECFRRAEWQNNRLLADALRESALDHLEQAHAAWRQVEEQPRLAR